MRILAAYTDTRATVSQLSDFLNSMNPVVFIGAFVHNILNRCIHFLVRNIVFTCGQRPSLILVQRNGAASVTVALR